MSKGRPKADYETKTIPKSLRIKPSILALLVKYGENNQIKSLSDIIEDLIIKEKKAG